MIFFLSWIWLDFVHPMKTDEIHKVNGIQQKFAKKIVLHTFNEQNNTAMNKTN